MTISKQSASAVSSDAFSLTVRDDGIALLKIDVPGEKMNTLRGDFVEGVESILEQIHANSDIQGVVVHSGKPDNFVAGADIKMLEACDTAEQASELGRAGQQLFAKLEGLTIPVVAAIHGPCLGGGLELALACHKRVCSSSPKTQLGLPEVQLGLLPGSGGTQRLPRLVGLAKSLDLILTGRSLRAKQALKAGLVDEMVPESILLDTAIKLAHSGKVQGEPSKAKQYRSKGINRFLEGTSAGRNVLFDQVRKRTRAKTHGNYPAADKIIDVIECGVNQGFDAGLALEAKCFGELVQSDVSAELRQIFFATTELKKLKGLPGDDTEPATLAHIGLLGGGLMGGGIAFVTASKADLPVRIKDIQQQGISNALKYSHSRIQQKVKRRFVTAREGEGLMAKISGGIDWRGFAHADVVVEAVFEDLAIKQQMVKDVEAHCKADTVFATNTSSIPITQIAQAAARPENVVGLHYFSPVEKMPLVEVITHDKVSPQSVATVVKLAKKQGKTPIVVKDGAGFYVNRILAPYMNEAARCLLEGGEIRQIDKALVDYGFPVGPFQLLDEVGVDIGAKISPILEQAFGERFTPPALFDALLGDKRLGRKTEKGFYQYTKAKGGVLAKLTSKKGKQVDEAVYPLLGISAKTLDQAQLEQIVERCVLIMLNEAVRCLDEGILASARDGDIGAVFGIGFPPFRGGPFRLIDSLGIRHVVERLQYFEQQFGTRFAPADGLLRRMEQQQAFYGS